MEIRNNHPFNWFIRIDPKTKKAKLVLSEKQFVTEPVVQPEVEAPTKVEIPTLWQKIKSWFIK